MAVTTANSSSVETYLLGLVGDFYRTCSKHPIFGEPKEGLVVAPYDSPRSNGVCWRNIMRKIAKKTYLRPISLGNNECWMIGKNSTTVSITKQSSKGETIQTVQIKIVRVLAFFKDPSDRNWAAVCSPDVNPFDHWCARGECRPDQQTHVCINGIEHGTFSDRATNEDRKKCTYGAVCLCPGHGPSAIKCIFTNSDGTLRPCRNNPTSVPQCTHTPRCF